MVTVYQLALGFFEGFRKMKAMKMQLSAHGSLQRLAICAWFVACLSNISLVFSTTQAVAHAAPEYRVGIGKADITGAVAEVVMMGYADMNQQDAGLLNRLYARAFIIESIQDSSQRIIFVNCDIHSVFQLVHQEVLAQLKHKYDGIYTEQNVVLHATHTHGGPGGQSAYFLYDFSIKGFINANFETIVDGILAAIDAAHYSMASGSIRFNKGDVLDGNKNRSPEAYNANPAEERALYADNRDTELRLLQFLDDQGKLRGLLGFYPVHPTSLLRTNLLVSGDNKGYAEFLLEEEFDGVIAAIGISNAGDISPNLVDNGDGTFSGEGATDIESAEIMGERQANKVMELLNSPSELLTGSILFGLSYVDFSNVTLHDSHPTDNEPFANRTCPAVIGQNFCAGTEDGRALAGFIEGSKEPSMFLRTVSDIIKNPPEWVRQCHTNVKVPLLSPGLMGPIPWIPEVLPVQLVKIGQFSLAVCSFEVTTMAGRRLRSTVLNALRELGVTEVEVASMSNAYAQYVTTKEEYTMQHYEGASTLFGPNQLNALQQEFARVAISLVRPTIPLDVGQKPRQFDRTSLWNFQPGVLFDTAPWSEDFGNVIPGNDARSSYTTGSTVTVSFYGGHPKNQFNDIHSFCDLEKEVNGHFIPVLTDSHWDLRFRWERMWISQSKSTCEWYIRRGRRTSTSGRYRIRHRGFCKPLVGGITAYEGVSSVFTVVDWEDEVCMENGTCATE